MNKMGSSGKFVPSSLVAGLFPAFGEDCQRLLAKLVALGAWWSLTLELARPRAAFLLM